MALSDAQKRIPRVALAAKNIANGEVNQIIDRMDREAEAVADLNQDISATYVEAEVQAISDKMDELLAALRAAGMLAS